MPNVAKFFVTLKDYIDGAPDTHSAVQAIVACATRLNYSRQDMARLRTVLLPGGTGTASIYRDSIARMLMEDATPPAPMCSVEHDELITDDYDWPVEKIANLALARRIAPRHDLAIVATARNEGLGLLEWVAYHLANGIERIFLYWNDNDDGSTALIEALAAAGVVTAIENRNSGKISVQQKVYEHSLQLLPELRLYRWAFYLDADEFFISRLGPEFDIRSVLERIDAQCHEEPIDTVMFNWKWFGSENIFERMPGLVLDRFEHSKPDPHVKCLVRLSNILSMCHVHFPIMINPDRIVSSDLMRLGHDRHSFGKVTPVYGLGQVNHYWNKSFEEFLIKKLRGGRGTNRQSSLDFRNFFEWGGNGSRGSFDPPPAAAMARTRKMLAMLREDVSIRAAEAEIEACHKSRMASIAADLEIRKIHANHGVT